MVLSRDSRGPCVSFKHAGTSVLLPWGIKLAGIPILGCRPTEVPKKSILQTNRVVPHWQQLCFHSMMRFESSPSHNQNVDPAWSACGAEALYAGVYFYFDFICLCQLK